MLRKKIIPIVLFLFLFCGDVSASDKKIVYFVDHSFPSVDLNGKGLWANICRGLSKHGYTMKWTGSLRGLQGAYRIVCNNIHPHEYRFLRLYPPEKLILFLWEPPTVRSQDYLKSFHSFFGKIYTWSDVLVDNVRYFKFYYPLFLHFPQKLVPFKEKKLCTMINCNKDSEHPLSLYAERRKVISFFNKLPQGDFDLHGYGWSLKESKNYKGTVNSKRECLKNYRFYFAYENMKNVPGYVTEKIFDAFISGCVPVYWGASNIANYVPNNCFIDRRDFKNNHELYQFLKAMSENEYRNYIENIRRFLTSDQSKLFSHDYFIQTIVNEVIL
jgi:alpha(1,3/1,4) fucosyltransferase